MSNAQGTSHPAWMTDRAWPIGEAWPNPSHADRAGFAARWAEDRRSARAAFGIDSTNDNQKENTK